MQSPKHTEDSSSLFKKPTDQDSSALHRSGEPWGTWRTSNAASIAQAQAVTSSPTSQPLDFHLPGILQHPVTMLSEAPSAHLPPLHCQSCMVHPGPSSHWGRGRGKPVAITCGSRNRCRAVEEPQTHHLPLHQDPAGSGFWGTPSPRQRRTGELLCIFPEHPVPAEPNHLFATPQLCSLAQLLYKFLAVAFSHQLTQVAGRLLKTAGTGEGPNRLLLSCKLLPPGKHLIALNDPTASAEAFPGHPTTLVLIPPQGLIWTWFSFHFLLLLP